MGRRTAGAALRILVAFSIGIRQNRSGKGERTENGASISRPLVGIRERGPSHRDPDPAAAVYFTGAWNVTSSFTGLRSFAAAAVEWAEPVSDLPVPSSLTSKIPVAEVGNDVPS